MLAGEVIFEGRVKESSRVILEVVRGIVNGGELYRFNTSLTVRRSGERRKKIWKISIFKG